MLYVLVDYGVKRGIMILGLDGQPGLKAAQEIVAHQVEGGFDVSSYHICKRIGPKAFEDVEDGKMYYASRHPFTEAAWDDFMSEWGK